MNIEDGDSLKPVVVALIKTTRSRANLFKETYSKYFRICHVYMVSALYLFCIFLFTCDCDS